VYERLETHKINACLIPFHPGQYFVAWQSDVALSLALEETAGIACNRQRSIETKGIGFCPIFAAPSANIMVNFVVSILILLENATAAKDGARIGCGRRRYSHSDISLQMH
jgi:hypothetical protein